MATLEQEWMPRHHMKGGVRRPRYLLHTISSNIGGWQFLEKIIPVCGALIVSCLAGQPARKRDHVAEPGYLQAN